MQNFLLASLILMLLFGNVYVLDNRNLGALRRATFLPQVLRKTQVPQWGQSLSKVGFEVQFLKAPISKLSNLLLLTIDDLRF